MGQITKQTDVEISTLIPYKNNAKQHSEEQIKRIADSITEFGFLSPILIDEDRNLIAGHGRVEAAKLLGLTSVPCVFVEGLTEAQRRAYILADNRLTELGEWDFDLVNQELSELDSFGFDVNLTGFSLDNIDMGADVVEDDFTPNVPDEPKAKRGDIYLLGDHRLMCGDSTVLSDVELLMDDAAADLVVTDPPYNMAYEGAGGTQDRKSKRIKNDNMPEDEFADFMRSVYANYYCVMKDGASIYTFYKELGNGVFITTMRDSGLTFKQELIWVKNGIVIGGQKYQNMYEPCLLGCKGKRIDIWNGHRNQRSVIESIDLMDENELRKTIRSLLADEEPDVIRVNKNLVNDLHPTMKPVRLISKFIENSSNRGGAVLDLFGGSGTTMIAAEQTGRRAYLMELDEKFVDVIIDRYQQFTGRKAQLLNRA